MPRNSSGVYSTPPGVTAVPNTTIESTPYNTNLADIATTFTDSLSRSGQGGMLDDLQMGGFKVSGMADPTLDADAATKGYVDGLVPPDGGPFPAEITVASATTCDILGAASDFIAISGTTAITSLGTGINRVRFVRFTGALTLTHNATSLILPGAANITTAAGDVMLLTSDGSSNVRVWSYVPAASATLLGIGPVTVASATTCNILGANSPLVSISGTTTITSFGTGTNEVRFVTFTGALILTHNATSLILPTGANITTAAGDTCIVISDGSSNARVLAYSPASGRAIVPAFGALTNLASATTTDLGTINSHNVNITGTTAITSLGSSASTALPIYFLTFADALTLTYDGTALILPGGVSITTAVGDTAIAQYLGSGNWQVISYAAANGQAVGGSWTQIGGTTNTTSGNSIAITNLPPGFQQFVIRFQGLSLTGSGSSVTNLALSSTNGVSYGANFSIAVNSAAASGYVNIDAVGISGLPKSMFEATSQGGSGGFVDTVTTGVIDAFKLSTSAGNFSTGSFTVWGIR